MSTRFLVLGCVVALLAGAAYGTTREMWVWVDAQGVRHFSDRPVPGAKLMTITSQEPTGGATPSPAPSTPSSSAAASRRTSQPAVSYRLLEIFQPESGESFFGADTPVNVRLRSEPELARGDVTRLYLDGRLVEGQPAGLEFTLSGLERGAHSMIAMIVDERGNERIRSEPRVFHIRQPSAVPAPNVGPNLRPPPPRPQPRPGG